MNKKQTVSSPFKQLVMWLSLSYRWIKRDRKRLSVFIEHQVTKDAVKNIEHNMYNVRFKSQPYHWTHKDLKEMCSKRIKFIDRRIKT